MKDYDQWKLDTPIHYDEAELCEHCERELSDRGNCVNVRCLVAVEE